MRGEQPAPPSLTVPDRAFNFFLAPPGMYVGHREGEVVLHTRQSALRLGLGASGFALLMAGFGYACLKLAATQNSPAAMAIWTPIVIAIIAVAWAGPLIIWWWLDRHHAALPPFFSKDERTGECRGRYFDRTVPAREAVALELLSFVKTVGNEYERQRVLVLRTRSPDNTDAWLLIAPQISRHKARKLAHAAALQLVERNLPKQTPPVTQAAR